MRNLYLSALMAVASLFAQACDDSAPTPSPTAPVSTPTLVTPTATPTPRGFTPTERAYIDRSHVFLRGVSNRASVINGLLPSGATPSLATEFDELAEYTDTWKSGAPTERLRPYGDALTSAVGVCGLAAAMASLAITEPGSIEWKDASDGIIRCFKDVIATQELLQSIEASL